jgi:hypothetical protein
MPDQSAAERAAKAWAEHLNIDPSLISEVEIRTDGGGHFTGLRVSIDIYTGRGLSRWLREMVVPVDARCQCGFPPALHKGPRMSCPVRPGKWTEQVERPVPGGSIHRQLVSALISAEFADWEEGEAELRKALKQWDLPYKLTEDFGGPSPEELACGGQL